MLLNLHDFAVVARERLDPAIWYYFAGGAGDEVTLQANESAFRSMMLAPRVLCGAGEPDLTTRLFGRALAMPVIVAPTAFHSLAHPGGECATATAVKAAGTIMIVSMAATLPIEHIAATGARLWFQLYLQPDRKFTEALVKRVEAAGCEALVVTVDSPVFGRRERDLRHEFTDLPAGLTCAQMMGCDGSTRAIAFSTALSWHDLAWLRTVTKLKLLVKGIMHPQDAHLAMQHGVDGIIVSNHGGRQLDGVAASVELLPAIVEAMEGAVPVLVDGGVRRGVDVLKAIALGASAVAIGRPVIWGLASDGSAGVRAVLRLLADELSQAAALCGLARPHDATPALLHWRTS